MWYVVDFGIIMVPDGQLAMADWIAGVSSTELECPATGVQVEPLFTTRVGGCGIVTVAPLAATTAKTRAATRIMIWDEDGHRLYVAYFYNAWVPCLGSKSSCHRYIADYRICLQCAQWRLDITYTLSLIACPSSPLFHSPSIYPWLGW